MKAVETGRGKGMDLDCMQLFKLIETLKLITMLKIIVASEHKKLILK